MKKILFVIILVSPFVFVYSQSLDELQMLNNKSKNQFIKPEVLDQLLIALRIYEENSVRTQDTLLLNTYINVSNAYIANNHFKQAYQVFYKYLYRKEVMLSEYKTSFIADAINLVSSRQQKDEAEEMELQKKLNQLKTDNDLLAAKRLAFKSNFSLALIILSSIFAIILVIAGIRKMGLRSKLQQNRDRMKAIHRSAVLGKFSDGLRMEMKNVLEKSKLQTIELRDLLKKQEHNFSPVKQANQIISRIDKIFEELPKNL